MDLGRVSEIDDTPPYRPEPAKPVTEHVAEFVGVGTMNTPLFTVERNWKVSWVSTEYDDPSLFIHYPDELHYESCGGTSVGVSYFYGIGTYYIRMITNGPWVIIVDYQ